MPNTQPSSNGGQRIEVVVWKGLATTRIDIHAIYGQTAF